MGAVTVVVTPELEELHLQIGGGPEQGVVQAFPSNRANESFDEWMRDRRVRHRLDLFHVICCAIRGHPQVGLRRFMSTTAARTSRPGPLGPGFVGTLDEKSRRYFRRINAR